MTKTPTGIRPRVDKGMKYPRLITVPRHFKFPDFFALPTEFFRFRPFFARQELRDIAWNCRVWIEKECNNSNNNNN